MRVGLIRLRPIAVAENRHWGNTALRIRGSAGVSMKFLFVLVLLLVPMISHANTLLCGDVSFSNFSCDVDYCYAALEVRGEGGQIFTVQFIDVLTDADLGPLANLTSACVPSDKITLDGNYGYASVKDVVEQK